MNKPLVNYNDYMRQTPLHWAVKRNYIQMIKLLIKNGANVNAKDLQKRTPLHLASLNGNLPLVGLLIANKANVFAFTQRKLTPSDMTDDVEIKKLIEKGKMFSIAMKFAP